jgi:hypothetical protein
MATDDDRLINRLQAQIYNLQKVQTALRPSSNPDLDAAIKALSEELDTLKVCFPFVYGGPPFQGKK